MKEPSQVTPDGLSAASYPQITGIQTIRVHSMASDSALLRVGC
jgi:hypothetical protein